MDILPVIWFFIIGFAVLMYVLLDGFVLGIGIIATFAQTAGERDYMMASAAPIWDGNETWLVMGGTALFAAFPKAYSIVLSMLYLPILFMLIALIVRGVSFEFRFKQGRGRGIWGLGFTLGSLVSAFMQGVILGALVEGLLLTDNPYISNPMFIWFSPFTMLTGVAVIFGYALLGATWLILKTENSVQLLARYVAAPLALTVIVFMGLVSAWLPFLNSAVMIRWFSSSLFLLLLPIPIAAVGMALAIWACVNAQRTLLPFILSLALFFLGFIGLVVGLWPNIIPPTLTIQAAASPALSQGFLLVGTAIMLPAVLANTAFSYYVFRGKVNMQEAQY